MSFTESLQKVVYTYIDTISKKYSLNVADLRELWDGKAVSSHSSLQTSIFTPLKSTTSTSKPVSVDTDDLSPARLNGCTKTELAALCRSKGLKVGGNKPELIERLLEATGQAPAQSNSEQSTLPFAKPAAKPVSTPKTTPTKDERSVVSANIVKKLQRDVKPIPVRSNKFGNFEHPETGLVIDRHTQHVYGRQMDDGTVVDLTPEDIQTAKMLGLPYTLPKNLDSKVDLDSVKVEDVDDESDIELKEKNEEDLAEEEDEEELPEEEDEEELAEED